MGSTKQKLSDYEDIARRANDNEELNPIDKFLLNYEASGIEQAIIFRQQFLDAINFEQQKTIEIPDWNKADKDGIIDMPDELDNIFNKVGMQLRFYTISGKNEIQTIADIVHICQKFFKEMYENK